jgi:transposase InsO family protein
MTLPKDRLAVISLIDKATKKGARFKLACETINLSYKTVQRWKRNESNIDKRTTVIKKIAHRLTDEEKNKIVNISNSSEFADLPPSQIVPKLADQNKYIASESSFYRVLKKHKMLTHRGKSKEKVKKNKPKEFLANTSNQIWSWDITYLKSTIKGKFFYLYMITDIFSRKIVGFKVHESESADNAAKLINASYIKEKISGNKLRLHSDNGSPMKGSTMLSKLQQLGVVPSFSRPSVSNDNAFSESLFKTMKYCPEFPDAPFDTADDAQKWVVRFVKWYNNEHLHSGIKFVTPCARHNNLDSVILNNRHKLYEKAKINNPARWTGSTRNWDYIAEVYLNKSSEVYN